MGSRSRVTHCWEVSQCENTQQRGLSTRAVTNNYQFPVSESADVCGGTPSHVAVQRECKTDIESPKAIATQPACMCHWQSSRTSQLSPDLLPKALKFQRESISQRDAPSCRRTFASHFVLVVGRPWSEIGWCDVFVSRSNFEEVIESLYQ